MSNDTDRLMSPLGPSAILSPPFGVHGRGYAPGELSYAAPAKIFERRWEHSCCQAHNKRGAINVTEQQAIAYAVLAMRDAGISADQANQVANYMIARIRTQSAEDAEEEVEKDG